MCLSFVLFVATPHFSISSSLLVFEVQKSIAPTTTTKYLSVSIKSIKYQKWDDARRRTALDRLSKESTSKCFCGRSRVFPCLRSEYQIMNLGKTRVSSRLKQEPVSPGQPSVCSVFTVVYKSSIQQVSTTDWVVGSSFGVSVAGTTFPFRVALQPPCFHFSSISCTKKTSIWLYRCFRPLRLLLSSLSRLCLSCTQK